MRVYHRMWVTFAGQIHAYLFSDRLIYGRPGSIVQL